MAAAGVRLHVIPVGGEEKPHVCGLTCFCEPTLERDVPLVVHYALDGRAIRERIGTQRPGELWIHVWEEMQPPAATDVPQLPLDG